jgi:hypothetical protein
VWIVERNFAEFSGEGAVITLGSVTSPAFGLGVMVRRCWKEPASSAVQSQEPKTKVSPRLKAAVSLMKIEVV